MIGEFTVTKRARITGEIFGEQEKLIAKYRALNEISLHRHSFCILEILIFRGADPLKLISLHVFIDGTYLTDAVGDGYVSSSESLLSQHSLIFATPTGSTAYSLSCNGSISHPNIPCIHMTPIAPISLSFRPIILPDNVKIELRVIISCSFFSLLMLP